MVCDALHSFEELEVEEVPDDEPVAPAHMVTTLPQYCVLERRIGSGSQGEIWRARMRSASEPAAVKLFPLSNDAYTELMSYRHLKKHTPHPHVLDLHFGLCDSASINLIFPLCRCDLLEHVLKAGSLDEMEASTWTRKLASAVAHLHDCDIVHLDIKLENVLIDAHGEPKLADLGLSAHMLPGARTSKTCGSGVYAAPEVLAARQLGSYDGRAADVWSLGVCSFVIVRGRFPFAVDVSNNLLRAYSEALKIARASSLPEPSVPAVLSNPVQRKGFSQPHLQLLDACLSLDPTARPSADQLAHLPWIMASRPAVQPVLSSQSADCLDDVVALNDDSGGNEPAALGGPSCVTPHASPRPMDVVNTTPEMARRGAGGSPEKSTLKLPSKWRESSRQHSVGGVEKQSHAFKRRGKRKLTTANFVPAYSPALPV